MTEWARGAIDALRHAHDELVAFAGGLEPAALGFGRRRVADPARDFALELREDGASLTGGRSDEVETLVALPAEALLRLTAGRLADEHTPATVHVDGTISLDSLRRVFPGY